MKTALITGANKGIGLEIARQLAGRGFKVLVSGRDTMRVEMAVRSLAGKGYDVAGVTLDVGNPASIRSAFEQLQKSGLTALDVLVNNAGVLIGEHEDILAASEADLMETLRTNSLGPLWMVQVFMPMLHKGARIINVSSSAGAISQGVSGYAPLYSSSKTLENAITLHLATALRSKGVVVNAVCPGWVKTDMGGAGANRSVAKGAETPVWLATEAPTSITGKFLRDKKEIPW